MVKTDQVEIHLGLSKRYRRQAAELCHDAFRQKFEPILDSPEHGVAILEAGLKSDLILMAVQQDQLTGVVGLEYGGHYFFDLKRAAFVREFGWLRGLIKMMLFIPFAQHHHQEDLTIGAIGVSPAMRGRGVGRVRSQGPRLLLGVASGTGTPGKIPTGGDACDAVALAGTVRIGRRGSLVPGNAGCGVRFRSDP